MQTRIADVLGAEFRLPRYLMLRYEAILFLMHHRFNISTSKKKLSFISLRDFEVCVQAIMNAWCVKAPQGSLQQPFRTNIVEPISESNLTLTPNNQAVAEVRNSILNMNVEWYSPFDFDTVLFAKFRDFKNRGNALIGEVFAAVNSFIEVPLDRKKIEHRFKPFFRGLVTCAGGRDLKDFFEDLVEDVVNHAIVMRVDLQKLFEIIDRAVAVSFVPSDVVIWQSLIAALRPCVLHLASIHPDRLKTIEFEEDD